MTTEKGFRFYRLTRQSERDGNQGFEFFASLKEAEAAARRWNQQEGEGAFAEVAEVVVVVPTKAGILAALNDWADHPDNG